MIGVEDAMAAPQGLLGHKRAFNVKNDNSWSACGESDQILSHQGPSVNLRKIGMAAGNDDYSPSCRSRFIRAMAKSYSMR